VDTGNAPATNVAAPTSIKDINIVGMASTQLDALISGVDKALTDMTSAAADLGSIGMRIDMQGEFVKKLSESIDKGIGRLVDADMNEESTRLKALQTQQQLAIQALSIANNDSQNVLSLFR
jgi:flagellin